MSARFRETPKPGLSRPTLGPRRPVGCRFYPLLVAFLATMPCGTGGDCARAASDEVLRCKFDEAADRNYDGWPDQWTRRHGPGFPQYVPIKIGEESSPSGGRCLRVILDGSGATAYSPAIGVDSLSLYVLEGQVKAEGLKHDRAWISLVAFDKAKQTVRTFASTRVGATAGWKRLMLGPVVFPAEACSAVIALHVEPQGNDEDLHGAVSFSDLLLTRSPRIALKVRRASEDKGAPAAFGDVPASHIFRDARKLEFACTASGLQEPSAELRFRVCDARGKGLLSRDMPLLKGSAVWQLPIPGPGFYRLVATVVAKGAPVAHGETTLAVTSIEAEARPARTEAPRPGLAPPPGSEFGWSLPRGAKPLELAELAGLLGQAGIQRVKYPLDGKPPANQSLETLVDFCTRLNMQGMTFVGLLDRAEDSDNHASEESRLSVLPSHSQALNPFLADPKIWYPSIEPIMARLATQIRWWQVGGDRDGSLTEVVELAPKLVAIRDALDQIGQGINLGMTWDWTTALPKTGSPPPWRFLALAVEAEASEREIARRLDSNRAADLQRWVSLEALPKTKSSPEQRAEHLVRRMVVAKVHGADAIFSPDPFDPSRGLMDGDGTPGELFLPWRTTAMLLGGAAPLGSMELPGGSTNHVFARHSDVMMVVWNDQATEEFVHLGTAVRQIDAWGRLCGARVSPGRATPDALVKTRTTAGTGASQGRTNGLPASRGFQVGRLPTFLVGLSEPIVRWQLAAALEPSRLPSIADQPHASALRLKNGFAKAIRGRAILQPPEGWRLEPRAIDFNLAENEQRDYPLQIVFPPDVLAGRQPVRIDFEIEADQDYRFGVVRRIEVGLGDVQMESSSRFNAQGELEVEQTLVNQGERAVSFRCELLIPDRRRESAVVLGLSPGSDKRIYRLTNGRELVGKTLWLRAVEVDGPRVLNHRVAVAAQ